MDNITLRVYKWNNSSNNITLQDECSSIKLNNSFKNMTAELQFTIGYEYQDYYSFNFEIGDEVILWYKGGKVFWGKILDSEFNLKNNTHTFTAYDIAWWTIKSNVTMNLDNLSVKDALNKVYLDIGIIRYDIDEELGDNANILIGTHLIKNKSAKDVLMAIMSEVTKKTGIYYYMHMNGNHITITECDKYYSGMTIKQSSKDVVDGNLIDYTIIRSTQNTINQIVVYNSDYTPKCTCNPVDIKRDQFGVIQDTMIIGEDENAEVVINKAQNIVAEKGKPTEEVIVKCLGDINYKVGYGVMVKLPDSSFYDKFMYIIASEWSWNKDGTFISTLSLSSSKHKELIEFSDIEEAQENEDGATGRSSDSAAVENAVSWMVSIALDDNHGYDQHNRWGPDYDCSSLVISGYEQAGIPLKSNGASYTGNMKSVCLETGFEVVSDWDGSTSNNLKRGDILLNEIHHAACYIGDGKIVQASINENGGTTGGQTGDQNQKEIYIRDYYNKPWDCVLRYKISEKSSNSSSGSSAGGVSNQYIELLKDLEGFVSSWDRSSAGGAIGYGTDASSTVGKRLKSQGITSCTKEQATEWLKEEIEEWATAVKNKCSSKGISLNQYYFDCMVDICYQWGNQKWNILDLLANGDVSSAKSTIMSLGYPRRDKARCNMLDGKYEIDE